MAKTLLRNYLINVGSLFLISQFIPALVIEGGFGGLLQGGVAFMLANITLVPLIRLLLLPLNLLTVGLFTWLANVIALYLLVRMVPSFKLVSYNFSGANFGGLTISPMELSTFQTAILLSFLLGFTIHFLKWLCEK